MSKKVKIIAAAKAVAACAEGKEKSVGQIDRVGVRFSDPIIMFGRKRIKIFFKTISVKKAVNKNAKENKKINFISRLLIPGFFLSSNIATTKIINNQIKIEDPFNEKNEKK